MYVEYWHWPSQKLTTCPTNRNEGSLGCMSCADFKLGCSPRWLKCAITKFLLLPSPSHFEKNTNFVTLRERKWRHIRPKLQTADLLLRQFTESGMMCSNSQLTGMHSFLSLFSFVINIEITEHNVEIRVKIITRFSEHRRKNEHHS